MIYIYIYICTYIYIHIYIYIYIYMKLFPTYIMDKPPNDPYNMSEIYTVAARPRTCRARRKWSTNCAALPALELAMPRRDGSEFHIPRSAADNAQRFGAESKSKSWSLRPFAWRSVKFLVVLSFSRTFLLFPENKYMLSDGVWRKSEGFGHDFHGGIWEVCSFNIT